MVFSVVAPRRKPWEDIPKPAVPATLEERWLDPVYRTARGIYDMSRALYGADAYPNMDTNIGPGSLGTFIGSPPRLSPETVWYEPNITDPEHHPECRFDPNDHWFKVHCALLDEAMRQCHDRYVVGLPDLIENIDILSQMRDP